jgi:hypothetical protein
MPETQSVRSDAIYWSIEIRTGEIRIYWTISKVGREATSAMTTEVPILEAVGHVVFAWTLLE